MNQRTAIGLTYLDLAKQAIENFLKVTLECARRLLPVRNATVLNLNCTT